MHTLKKFSAAPSAAKLLNIFFAALRAVQHSLYTSNLLPTPMGRDAEECRMKGCGSSVKDCSAGGLTNKYG